MYPSIQAARRLTDRRRPSRRRPARHSGATTAPSADSALGIRAAEGSASASASAGGGGLGPHLHPEGDQQPVLRRRRRRARRRPPPSSVARSSRSARRPRPRPSRSSFIQDATTQGYKAIAVSANDADEVAPALKAAQDAGHQGRRLRLQPGRGRLRRLRQPDRLQPDRQARWPSGPATSPRTAPARSPSCRPPPPRPTRTPGSRTWRRSSRPTRSTRTSSSSTPSTAMTTRRRARTRPRASSRDPDLKVIVAPTTVGILAAAQVVKQAGSRVKVTGLGLPNDMRAYVGRRHLAEVRPVERARTSATSPTTSRPCWSPARSPAPRRDVHGPGLNGDQPYTIGDSVVILGPPFEFNAGQHRPVQLLGGSSTARPAADQRERPRGLHRGASHMERIGFAMRLLPGAEAEYRPPARRRLAGDARRADGRRRPQLLDLPPRRRPVRLPRGRRLRRFQATWPRARSTPAGRPTWASSSTR